MRLTDCYSLTSVTIPNSVTNIGDSAFEDCAGLTSVTIPNSVTSIGDNVFYGCASLTNVTIRNSVTSIGDYAFYGCTSLTSVTIPNSVTSIGSDAFYGCTNLTKVAIGTGVASIGTQAFYDCTSLTSLTIPSSVTNIGGSAFLNCTNLTSVFFKGNAPTISPFQSPFQGDNSATVYYLPGTTGWGSTFRQSSDRVVESAGADQRCAASVCGLTNSGSTSPAAAIWSSWWKPAQISPFPLDAGGNQHAQHFRRHQRHVLFQRSAMDELSRPFLPAPLTVTSPLCGEFTGQFFLAAFFFCQC